MKTFRILSSDEKLISAVVEYAVKKYFTFNIKKSAHKSYTLTIKIDEKIIDEESKVILDIIEKNRFLY